MREEFTERHVADKKILLTDNSSLRAMVSEKNFGALAISSEINSEIIRGSSL